MGNKDIKYYGLYNKDKLVGTIKHKCSEGNWKDNIKGLDVRLISEFEYYHFKKNS